MWISERRATAQEKQPTSLPNPHNATEMQAFFLQEVQLGEELLAAGISFYLQIWHHQKWKNKLSYNRWHTV